MLQNSEILANLTKELSHLSQLQQQQIACLILEFVDLFPDLPGRTARVQHDVDVMDVALIKQHPYWVNPIMLQFVRKEVEYMLDYGIIEPSSSKWSSPCLLVSKSNGVHHFVLTFKRLIL